MAMQTRKWARQTIKYILAKIAWLIWWRHRPGVIGVTGSVGKTSTKLAIAEVLKPDYRVRCSPGNLNTEFGLPLVLIGGWTDDQLQNVSWEAPPTIGRWRKGWFWLGVICRGLKVLLTRQADYPEILILEYGADRPGDIHQLLQIIEPNVSVVTAVGEIPVHGEHYSGTEEVVREKAGLVECLPAAGFTALNCDDPRVLAVARRTRAQVLTYGFAREAQLRISGLEHRVKRIVDQEKFQLAGARPWGVVFKLEYGSVAAPVRMAGVFGRAQVYAAAAAAAIGIIFGLKLEDIAARLGQYQPPPGRATLLPAIKDSYLLDDSYNASPLSVRLALETLAALPGRRKVAILGDMLELGPQSDEAHEQIGRLAAGSADVLITVGRNAKHIAAGARAEGMPQARIWSFNETSDEAIAAAQRLVAPGDLILVKASHAMHFADFVVQLRRAGQDGAEPEVRPLANFVPQSRPLPPFRPTVWPTVLSAQRKSATIPRRKLVRVMEKKKARAVRSPPSQPVLTKSNRSVAKPAVGHEPLI
ncbi:MAG: UDP-N-acetylmuramoyl-tripeptide--D-alanyl-D-alanine ligase [Candidatus Liptonbacteria bacterium]|nr:UDP-N-acetylmuramoyl-tripeptide--D-alanyl-D-alanine ligase [Candidatus Liptonbacteria bacterium]